MRWNSPPISSVVLVLAVAFAVAGCHELINPWSDTTAGPELVTTSSAEAVRAADLKPDIRTRDFKPEVIMPQDGTVSHFPLWWQDPFASKGSEDGKFAWTWVDYFAMPYGLGRFIVNTIGWPVSVVVEPPLPLMGSDGVLSRQILGYDHDAQWLPARGTPTPPDILELGALPPPNHNEVTTNGWGPPAEEPPAEKPASVEESP